MSQAKYPLENLSPEALEVLRWLLWTQGGVGSAEQEAEALRRIEAGEDL